MASVNMIDLMSEVADYHEKLKCPLTRQQAAIALNVEIVEVLNELPWKPWRPADYKEINKRHLVEEAVDVFFFYEYLVGAAGLTWITGGDQDKNGLSPDLAALLERAGFCDEPRITRPMEQRDICMSMFEQLMAVTSQIGQPHMVLIVAEPVAELDIRLFQLWEAHYINLLYQLGITADEFADAFNEKMRVNYQRIADGYTNTNNNN